MGSTGEVLYIYALRVLAAVGNGDPILVCLPS